MCPSLTVDRIAANQDTERKLCEIGFRIGQALREIPATHLHLDENLGVYVLYVDICEKLSNVVLTTKRSSAPPHPGIKYL